MTIILHVYSKLLQTILLNYILFIFLQLFLQALYAKQRIY